MAAQNTYSCSRCEYTTNRKFNLDRHTRTMHINIETSDALNVESSALNVEPGCMNVDTDGIQCPTCYKVFKHKRYMHVHSKVCSRVSKKHECRNCHKVCSSASALSHHKEFCKALQDPGTSSQGSGLANPTHNTNNIRAHSVQNAQVINNNNTFIINYPEEGDADFEFKGDHITHPRIEKIWGKVRPDVGFRKYAHAMLERTENRMIYKNNPNTKYCKVHRDGVWEMELDKDALPVLTNQLSIAALGHVNDYRERIKRTRIDVATILRYLEDINTENDENDNYTDAEERIKLVIINMSQRWGLPTIEV